MYLGIKIPYPIPCGGLGIGLMVFATLRMRFASIERKWTKVGDFISELNQLQMVHIKLSQDPIINHLP